MPRVLSLESLGGSITADPHATGVQATARLTGTGLPPVSLQWFEGAGDGASYRGGRVLARPLELELKVYGVDRAAVWDRLSLLGRIFALDAGDVRLRVSLDGDVWFLDVRRSGGGDWSWDSDTDGSTFVRTVIAVQAGDPFWTREDEEAKRVLPGGLGRGLLRSGGSLSQLRVSTNTAQGAVTIENTGDVPAFPVSIAYAPFSQVTLTSPRGEQLVYQAAKSSGFIRFDHALGTVVDEAGVNRYAHLAPRPRFWSIPAGVGVATIEALDAVAPGTEIMLVWRPRKWVMF